MIRSTESSGCKVLNLALLIGEIGLLLAESKSYRFASLLIFMAFKDGMIGSATLFFKYGFELIFCLKKTVENALA